jgi:hypothetical protein
LAEVIQPSGLQARTETHDFLANRHLRGDVYIPYWGLEGKPLALDVRVVSPVQKKYLKKAAEHALAAALDAEKLKDAKYADACEAAGVDFRAFVLMSHKTVSSGADCIEHIWRHLSVALQRGNARCFLQRETFDHESDRKFHSERMEDTYHLPREIANCLNNSRVFHVPNFLHLSTAFNSQALTHMIMKFYRQLH